jgi:hypothetical protein
MRITAQHRTSRTAAVVVVLALGLAGCSFGHPTDVVQVPGAAQDISATSGGPSLTPTPRVPGRWLSGASGGAAATGAFGRWRHQPVTIGGTWANGNAEMLRAQPICPGGDWARWTKPLDLAVGAIDVHKGDSWATAARGGYDARWRASLMKIKKCWGDRNPANLYLRFAHEMNLSDLPWQVKGGEEADFVRAITRYSNLRYAIIPKAKIVLCPSDGTDQRLKIDINKLWPGKDARGRPVVDVYAVDTYNSWVVVHNAAEFADKLTATQADMPLGLELHRQFAEQHGVPFAISEWSNNGNPRDPGKGGEHPEYMQLMNQWFRENAGDPAHPAPGRLLYEIQFNNQPQFQIMPTRYQPKTAAAYRALTWGH